jgi:hypothetical protein
LIDLYNALPAEEQNEVYLIPDKYVTPFDAHQAYLFKTGEWTQHLEDCLNEAYAVHYFFSNWRTDND